MNRRKLIFLIIGVLAVIGVCTVLLFATVETTGTHEFCASCHEMKFFEETWMDSSHGTAAKGIAVAECVDCHLPHGTVFYLATKAKSGLNDTVAHVFKRKYDWFAIRERRNQYTYESGCKRCHENLLPPGMIKKAYEEHQDYLDGKTDKSCVDCHIEIGHGNLVWKLKHLNAKQAEELDITNP